MNKILITGASGFLGTHYSRWADKNNTSLIKGTTSKIEKGYTQFHKNYENILSVLKDENISAVIHFASAVPQNYQTASFKETFLPNMQMMDNLVNFAIEKKVRKFIYISGFGSIERSSHPLITDFYTMSKVCGDYFISILNSIEMESVALKLSAPYGEFLKKKNVINTFINNALRNQDLSVFGTGMREQNFIYAEDVCRAVDLSLKNNISGVYEIVSPRNINMIDLANLVIKLTESSSKIEFSRKIDPQESFRPSYDHLKAETDFGFKTKFSIEDGLEKYIAWLKK